MRLIPILSRSEHNTTRRSILSVILLVAVTTNAPALGAEDAEHLQTDLLIVGGTESGCAAAIQAARMGVKSIVLVNDIEWPGGQFSAEGLVAIDENTNVVGTRHEQPLPRSGLFKEAIERIEAVNLRRYGQRRPGNTRVITTCRPADAAAVFKQLLEPYVVSGQLRIKSRYYPVAASLVEDGKTLRSVRFCSTRDGASDLEVSARLTIDASDWGEVVKLSGAAYEFGPDLKSKYNEPEAPTSRKDYPITDMNPITWTMVLVETDQEQTIPEPTGYDARNYRGSPAKVRGVAQEDVVAPITFLEWQYPNDVSWLYASRRVVDHYHFPTIKHPDVVLLCFPAIDYPLDVWTKTVTEALEADEPGASQKNIVQMTRRQREIVFADARRYSLGFLYYLQTAVHERMKDKTRSFRRFALTDEFGTPDRLPPKPYVRESLRLKAMYMMRQQDTLGHGGSNHNFAHIMYHDSVACWQFEYDFHPTSREFLEDGDPSGPWQCRHRPLRNWGPPFSGMATFPMRSLIPENVDGLLGAQHNLGFSSIVSSAVRLHDHSMAVGQATGATAAVALRHSVQPRILPYRSNLLSEVWSGLAARHQGGEPAMLWPFRDLLPEHPAFEAINLLAVRGGLPLKATTIDFQPDAMATPRWRKQVVERSLATKLSESPVDLPQGNMTRGEFAQRWWLQIKDLPNAPFPRQAPGDADADGLADPIDPLPLDPASSSWPSP